VWGRVGSRRSASCFPCGVGSTSHEPRQHDVCPLSLLASMQAAQEVTSLMPRAWLRPSGDHLRAGVRQAVQLFMRAAKRFAGGPLRAKESAAHQTQGA
jgi:hypothetical protein